MEGEILAIASGNRLIAVIETFANLAIAYTNIIVDRKLVDG
jgi:hypothetical protein